MSERNSRRRFLKQVGATGIAAAAVTGMNASAEINPALQQTHQGPVNEGDINPKRVMLEDCTRKEVREWIASGNLKAAIIPTASTEQHNEHLALSMDTSAAVTVAKLAALLIYPNAIVTPPVAFGICPFFMKRQGSITIREEIFTGLVYDICCSMKVHGIKAIFICNGHGGNTPIRRMGADFTKQLGIPVEAHSYWESISRAEQRQFVEKGDLPGHADEFETSFALAAFPEKVRRVEYDPAVQYLWEPAKEDLDRVGYREESWFSPQFDASSFEVAKLATAEKGEKTIARSVEWVADRIMKMLG
jgi:creatinine amidohydrolase